MGIINHSQNFIINIFLNNINKMHYYLILKLIFIIYNLSRLINNNAEIIKLLILYNFDSHFIYLNNWQDKHYFIKAFLILFLFKDS